VTGEFGILTKVLQHPIGNAIEYNETTSPRVHVSSRRQDNEWIFSVQDNGPGIDPAFQGRLFGPFKRLHGKEYHGNGLGLAFCKKVIERRGGRVWMESTPGEGPTFYFTLAPALSKRQFLPPRRQELHLRKSASDFRPVSTYIVRWSEICSSQKEHEGLRAIDGSRSSSKS
jgi:hypothetical protein